MTASREEAERELTRSSVNPAWAQAWSIRGLGYAVLDLADAVRESKPRRPSMAELDAERKRHGLDALARLAPHLGQAVQNNDVWCCPCGQVLANTREDAHDRMVDHITTALNL